MNAANLSGPFTAWALAVLFAVVPTCFVGGCANGSRPPQLVIGVASSAAGVVEAIAGEWAESSGYEVRISSASSSTLARQVERGSPVDVLVSADRAWVDYLTALGIGRPETVRMLAGNQLVIYARADRAPVLGLDGRDLASGAALEPAMMGARWTTGDPGHVPLGRYGKDALVSLGWWGQLEPSLLPVADARAAARLVEMGQADFGLGYSTDVVGPQWVSCPLAPSLHGRIEVIGIRVSDSHPAAGPFLAYLAGPDAQSHWRAAGFRPHVFGHPDGASPAPGGER